MTRGGWLTPVQERIMRRVRAKGVAERSEIARGLIQGPREIDRLVKWGYLRVAIMTLETTYELTEKGRAYFGDK